MGFWKNFFLLCTLFILFNFQAYSNDGNRIVLSLEEVIHQGKENDLELKSLTFSLKELLVSKKDIYRSFFPAISTSFSTTDMMNYGETDSRSYDLIVKLDQILYNQLSSPLMFKNYGISIEEAKIKIDERKKYIEKRATTLYLQILLEGEKIKNKREEIRLYQRFLELMEEEYRIGMKTILEVIDTEKKLLEVELKLEKLTTNREILFKDLINLIGIEGKRYQISLKDSINSILSSQLNLRGTGSLDDVYPYMIFIKDKTVNGDILYATALENDFDIKKLRLSLLQNRIKKKLYSIQFLENVSLSYEVDFTGEQFFPANTSHTLALNLLLDFGILSSDVSLSESRGEGLRSQSQSAESNVLESFNPQVSKRYLKVESYTASERIREIKRDLQKELEIWVIKMNSLIKSYEIMLKERDIFQRNTEIFQIKLEIGEIKEVDFFDFLIKKNEFLIEFEGIKYNFISLIWELEETLNKKIIEFIE